MAEGDKYVDERFYDECPAERLPCNDPDEVDDEIAASAVAVPEGEAKPARTVTHQMARDSFRKMHDALYNNAPIPSLSIPARLDDADIVLSDYICQQRDLATPPTNPVSTEKWRVGRKLGRTLYIGDRFIGSVDTPELASKIVEAVNAGGVSTAGMTAEEFAKTWEGFRGQNFNPSRR